MQKVIENRIYHYCKLTTGIEDILSSKQLLLANLLNTNDPRENKSFVFSARYFENDKPDNLELSNEKISEILRQDCKVLCFTKDSSKLTTFGYENSSMWAHYGDRHKGLCLLLDMPKFIEENKEKINPKLFKSIKYKTYNSNTFHKQMKRINYTEKNKLGEEKYLKEKFRKKHIDYLYFTKSKEWEHENEIRLIHFSSDKKNEFVSIENSLRGIYLGVDFNKNYLPTINELTNNINKFQLKYILILRN